MNMVSALERAPGSQPDHPSGVLTAIKTYRRHLPVFFLCAVSIFLATALYTYTRAPRFTATANVVVSPRKAEVGSDRSSPLSDPTTDASVDTQVEVVRSPMLAGQVIDALHLTDPEQYGRLTYSAGIRQRLGFDDRSQAGPLPPLARRRARVADILERNLSVRRVAQTFVLELEFTALNRNSAAQIANAFAAAYVRQSLDLKLQSARRANTLLSAQLTGARNEVSAAERAVGQYKIAHNLMNLGDGTVTEQELTGFDQQVAGAKASQAEADARYRTAQQQLARGSSGQDVGEALGSPVVQDLRRQRADISRRVASLSSRYNPAYPALATATQELADIDNQIQAEIGRIISNLKAQSDVASRRTASLQSSLDQAHGALASNNIASVKLGELQLRANAARGLYEQLLARVREIGTQAATTQADARISALASPPALPSSPNVPINLLVGALLGIACGIAAVMLRQGVDQGLRTLEDVEIRLNQRYLAGLPTLTSSIDNPDASNPLDAVVQHKQSAYTEGFRSLGASLLQSRDGRKVRSILITSALPNEGKTTTAISLGRVLAMGGRRVVVVDADLRRPRIAEALGLQPQFNLRDVLEGRATLESALVPDRETGATILPLLAGREFAASPVEDGRFDALIGELEARFDVVILDASPILPVIDGRLLARRADAVAVLVRWRATPLPAVEMALHLLQSAGASLSGIALSRIDLQAVSRSGYGDPAKYLKMYNKYYNRPEEALC